MNNEEYKQTSSNGPDTATDSPAQQAQADTQGDISSRDLHQQQQNTTQPSAGSGRFSKRLIVLIGVAAFFVVGGSAGAYFGVVVPNKPENIWRTALTNTSKGYDKFATYLDDTKAQTGSTIDGTLKLNSDITADGTFKAEMDEKQSKFSFDIGAVGSRVKVEGVAVDAATSDYPDVYIKASGIKGIDAALGAGGLFDQFEDKWIAIDHTLLDTYASQSVDTETEKSLYTALTTESMARQAAALREVNDKYLLSTDPNTAVFTVVTNVGRENKDSRSVYHYKVGVNKQHLKSYVDAATDVIAKTTFDGKDLKANDTYKEMQNSINELDETYTADVYVDTKTKLVRAVHFPPATNADGTVDIVMPYDGGSVLPFKITMSAKDDAQKSAGTMTLDMSLDMKRNSAKMVMAFDMPSESSKPIRGNVTMNITSNNNKVDVTAPKDAISAGEVLGMFFGGSSSIDQQIELEDDLMFQ